jgi:hypothetical protein
VVNPFRIYRTKTTQEGFADDYTLAARGHGSLTIRVEDDSEFIAEVRLQGFDHIESYQFNKNELIELFNTFIKYEE